MQLETIAILESCYKEKFGTPRQGLLSPSSQAIVRMLPEYSDFSFIQDLKLYSHLWLIAGFHLSLASKHSKIRVPRMRGGRLSVFATRSPHRPNPIALSLVKLHSIEEGFLRVSGIDLVDQSPIYDIKPYIPEYDLQPEASSELLTKDIRMEVEFSERAEAQLADEEKTQPTRTLRQLIIGSLSQDPRPLAYLEKYPERTYGLSLYDKNIRFTYKENRIFVESIDLQTNADEATTRKEPGSN